MLGLEGIVSRRAVSSYRSGPSRARVLLSSGQNRVPLWWPGRQSEDRQDVRDRAKVPALGRTA